jgi:hypothetical protein
MRKTIQDVALPLAGGNAIFKLAKNLSFDLIGPPAKGVFRENFGRG